MLCNLFSCWFSFGMFFLPNGNKVQLSCFTGRVVGDGSVFFSTVRVVIQTLALRRVSLLTPGHVHLHSDSAGATRIAMEG